MRLRKINSVSFDELTHSYICGDKLLLGVTALLHKYNIGPDLSDIPEKILQNAAEYGTAVHEAIEAYEDKKEESGDNCSKEVKAYKTLNLDVHCCEYLVSDGESVASMIDLVLKDCSLVDVKTWAKMDHEREVYVRWQLSVYAYLFEHMNPSKKVPHIYVARVRNDYAELIELERIPEEEVKALIDAERQGLDYEFVETVPEVSLVLPEQEALTLVETLDIIAQYKAALKAEEERASAIQDKLYQYMVDNDLDEMACTRGKFIRKAEYTRTSIDSAKLKAEQPDIYEAYQKRSVVKGSVTFKATLISK